MGANKKRDRRAANYQERQRQAAAAKAEKERQERQDRDAYWSNAVVPYASGGIAQHGTVTVIPQMYVSGNIGWHSHTTITPATAKVDLPKSESTEVITAYRMWPLIRTFPEGYRLAAANHQFDGRIQPYAKLVADCKGGFAHTAPAENCQCGIHAYAKSVPLEHQGKPYAAGEVYLWGKVIEHEDGFRAQYAYPKKLYVIDGGSRADKIAEALAWTYGIPCEVWDG